MPICEVCDSETFESRNGLYYCLTCGTQTQDIRDEVVEEQVDIDQRLAVSTKKGKMGRKPFERTSGKPWLMQEAFQLIIKKQVEFLINYGADQKLKDVVGQIWFKYLRKTGIAFFDSKDGHIALVGKSSKSGINLHNARMLGKEKPRKRKKHAMTEDDLLELCSEMSRDLDEEDDSDSLDDPDDPQNSSSDSELELDYIGSYIPYIGNRRRQITLRQTIAFTYLGVLILNEPIFLSDILRWVREGNFPYCEASNFLPSYMKFSKGDSTTISTKTIPLKKDLLRDCVYIMKLLDLSLPDQNLRKYTSKFILNLNLPAITHGLVNNLLKVYEPDYTFWKFHQKKYRMQSLFYEETAMAYIFIALKMCYRLDDSQDEGEASLAENLSVPESRDTLPVWRDWVNANRQCQDKIMASGCPWTREQLGKLKDPRAYTNFCKTHVFGDWAIRDREMTSDVTRSVISAKKKYSRKEYRESCLELFSAITGDISTSVPSPTSFPGTCNHSNESTNENRDDCFSQTKMRRIPLDSFKQLCVTTATEQQVEDGGKAAFSSRRKYVRHQSCSESSHLSCKFLVNLMASHIESKPELLENTIVKMEKLLIPRD